MANTTLEISNVCRFCLCQHGLIPVSKATASLLTIQDIQHFTGIQIPDEEQLSYAMCDKCSKVLENSVAFRSTCMDNDVIFKQLFSELVESVMDNSEGSQDMEFIIIEPVDSTFEDDIGSELPAYIASSASEPEDTMVISNDENHTQGSNRTMTPKRRNARIRKKPASQSIHNDVQFGRNLKSKKLYERKSKLCDICGKLVMCMLTHSKEQHSESKEYICPHCPIKMSKSMNMKRHIEAVHLKLIIKSCEQCGKGFRHKITFDNHMKIAHGIGYKAYECKICSETFDMQHLHKYHMNKLHRAPKEFACSICSMVFNKKAIFKNHQRVHSSDQPFACSLCPKRFKNPWARRTHELTHSGIRFSCNFCPKSYRYKTLLNMHHRKDHGGAIPPEVTDDCDDV